MRGRIYEKPFASSLSSIATLTNRLLVKKAAPSLSRLLLNIANESCWRNTSFDRLLAAWVREQQHIDVSFSLVASWDLENSR